MAQAINALKFNINHHCHANWSKVQVSKILFMLFVKLLDSEDKVFFFPSLWFRNS